jgi:hypothetical protein
MLGVEPSDMSSLFFMDYCKSRGALMQMRSGKKNGGQHFRLVHGMLVAPVFFELIMTTSRNSVHLQGSGTITSARVSNP